LDGGVKTHICHSLSILSRVGEDDIFFKGGGNFIIMSLFLASHLVGIYTETVFCVSLITTYAGKYEYWFSAPHLLVLELIILPFIDKCVDNVTRKMDSAETIFQTWKLIYPNYNPNFWFNLKLCTWNSEYWLKNRRMYPEVLWGLLFEDNSSLTF